MTIGRPRLLWTLAVAARIVTFTLLAVAAPEASDDPSVSLEQFGLPQVVTLRGSVFHIQGLDVDEDFIYVTSVDTRTRRGLVHKFTTHGDLVKVVDVTDGTRYHVGGLSLDGDSLWVPVAEYRSRGSTRVVQLDKQSLAPVSSFTVADHIGALTTDDGRIFGANWDAEHFYVWNRAGATISRTVSRTRVAYQDVKMIGGELVASGVMRDAPGGSVDWIHPETFALTRRLTLSSKGPGSSWNREGMALKGDALYLAPEDGRGGATSVYVFSLASLRPAILECSPDSTLMPTCSRDLRVASLGRN